MITIDKVLKELNITGYMLYGEPTNESEFLEFFKKQIGVSDDRIILSDNPSDFGVTWSQIKTKYNELVASKPLEDLREERNKLLSKTDWWACSDLTMTQAQIDYRQALRDITDNATSLDDVTWPVKP
jgi:hypothetical protein